MRERGLPERPYPGLRPFRKHEWSIFFGREPMIDAVLDLLGRQQLVVVHGSSGCGKSSLVKAGVLPRLEQELSLYGVPWRTVEMRPGRSPLWNLAEAISCLVQDLPDDQTPSLDIIRAIRRLLNLGRLAFAELQERHGVGQSGNVCLLLDQFEELFRYAREIGRDEANTLIDVLKAFEERPPKGIYTIIAMRSDHLGDCAQFTGFAELVNQTQYLLPRMGRPELMQAIREPARLFGGDVSVDLALRLIDESQSEIDALPLVQHCLMRLWRQAGGSARARSMPASSADAQPLRHDPENPDLEPVLNMEGYLGLQPMLSKHADEVLADLAKSSASAERITENLFRATTEIDREGRGIRRPLTRSHLVPITGNQPAVLDRVIDHFADPECGFLVRSADLDPVIDIGHEALIRCWTRINDPDIDETTKRPKGWLYREQEDSRLWRALLVQYEARENISAALLDERRAWFEALTGPAWADRYGGGWDLVKDLIERSQEARDLAKRRGRYRRIALVSVTVLILAAITLGYLYQRRLAQEAERLAQEAGRHRIAAVATSIAFLLELQHGVVAPSDRAGLTRLARASAGEKLGFVDALFRLPPLAERFTRNPAVVTRALVGLDQVARRELEAHAFGSGAVSLESERKEIRHAKALLGIELATTQAVPTVLAVMQETSDAWALRCLGEGLAALAPRLTGEQARQAVAPVLATMQETSDPWALRSLGDGLAALAPRLTSEQAQEAIARILATIQGTSNPWALRGLCEGLAAVPVELSGEQAQQVTEAVLHTMQKTTDPGALRNLSEGLAALPVELSGAQAQQAIAPVLTAMQKTTHPAALRALSDGLVALPAELSGEQAQQAIDAVLHAVEEDETTDPAALRELSEGLAALASHLSGEQAQQAIGAVLDIMQEKTTDPEALQGLGEGLAALTPRLADAQAVEALVDAMRIPWMAGAPTKPLLRALGNLTEEVEGQAGFWDTIAKVEEQFDSAVDLTSPP